MFKNAINGAFKEALFYNRRLADIAKIDLAYANKEISAAEAMRRIRKVLEIIGSENFD